MLATPRRTNVFVPILEPVRPLATQADAGSAGVPRHGRESGCPCTTPRVRPRSKPHKAHLRPVAARRRPVATRWARRFGCAFHTNSTEEFHELDLRRIQATTGIGRRGPPGARITAARHEHSEWLRAVGSSIPVGASSAAELAEKRIGRRPPGADPATADLVPAAFASTIRRPSCSAAIREILRCTRFR